MITEAEIGAFLARRFKMAADAGRPLDPGSGGSS
jgi:hypothetical protein